MTQIAGIDSDSTGAAYITGTTNGGLSTKNPVQASLASTPGGYDAFLAKLTTDGSSILYSTYLGGAANDSGLAVRADSTGSVIVAGSTYSGDFPTFAAPRPLGSYQDGFITKYSAAGDAILFSTYLGGNQQDIITSLALDATGSMYVGGSTSSSDFPSSGSRYYGTAFVAKLSGPVVSIPVTFTTVASGLQVTVDGITVKTPATFQWAPGVSHTIDVPSPQSLPGPNVSNWISWSNGGSKSQTIATPTAATTFTATLDNVPCSYSFPTPTSVSYGQAGNSGINLAINTQPGCPWTPTSSAAWLSLNSSAIQNGPGYIYYSVAANTAGGTRTGTITVAGAVFTITQSFSTPVITYPTSCCSNTNSGLSQTFNYTVTDPDGTNDLTVSNLLINSALDGRQACYLAFDHVANILYLVNDAGTTIAGMPFDSGGRGSGVLSNSQCSVDGTKTSLNQYSYNNQAQLTIGLTFAPSFGGNKVLYLAARDKELMNSGWQPLGTWNIPMTTTYPNVVSASTGYYNSSSNPTTVAAIYQDSTANTNLSPSQILINSAVDGRGACYLGYDHKNNILYLVKDDGATLLPGITPGQGTATQQNSQCIIYAKGSSVTANGKNYTLDVQVFFMPAFQGPKIIYAATQTLTGANTG